LTGNGDFVRVVDDSLVRFQVAEPTRTDFDRLERRPITVEPVGPVDVIEAPEPSPSSKEEPAPDLDLSLLLAAGEAADSGGEPCVDARTLAIYFYEKQLSIARPGRSMAWAGSFTLATGTLPRSCWPS
jgi:hypothetical protein